MHWGTRDHHVVVDHIGLHEVTYGTVTETVPWHLMSRVDIKTPLSDGARTAGIIASFVANVVLDGDLDGPGESRIVTSVYGDPKNSEPVATWLVPMDPQSRLTKAAARETVERINAAIYDPYQRPRGPQLPPAGAVPVPSTAAAPTSEAASEPAPTPAPAPAPAPSPGRQLFLDEPAPGERSTEPQQPAPWTQPEQWSAPRPVGGPVAGPAPQGQHPHDLASQSQSQASRTGSVPASPGAVEQPGLGAPPWAQPGQQPRQPELGAPPWAQPARQPPHTGMGAPPWAQPGQQPRQTGMGAPPWAQPARQPPHTGMGAPPWAQQPPALASNPGPQDPHLGHAAGDAQPPASPPASPSVQPPGQPQPQPQQEQQSWGEAWKVMREHMRNRVQPIKLGGFLSDDFATVDPEGFEISAPRVRGGLEIDGSALRTIPWDRLAGIDGELLKSREGDLQKAARGVLWGGLDGVTEVPVRGYLRLRFYLRDHPQIPVQVDLPRSIGWNPDEAWLAGFLANARRAIVDPPHRATFTR